jgi:hypothetical protein
LEFLAGADVRRRDVSDVGVGIGEFGGAVSGSKQNNVGFGGDSLQFAGEGFSTGRYDDLLLG